MHILTKDFPMSAFKTMTGMILSPAAQSQGHKAAPIEIQETTLTRLIGTIPLLLPVLVVAVTALIGAQQQASISAYYYVPFASTIFEGLLFFTGLFMFAYRGHTIFDKWLAKAGGIFAIGVALFPTKAASWQDADGILRIFADPTSVSDSATSQTAGIFNSLNKEWTTALDGLVHKLHVGSAVIFFSILALFCLISFRRNNGEGVCPQPDGTVLLTPAKRARNAVYLACGGVIVLCLLGLWLIYKKDQSILILGMDLFFWLEAVALYAFGISWLIKGRVLFSEDPACPVKAGG
jgi:multisubunit Na+/H+ antiporter MnhC subunit